MPSSMAWDDAVSPLPDQTYWNSTVISSLPASFSVLVFPTRLPQTRPASFSLEAFFSFCSDSQ